MDKNKKEETPVAMIDEEGELKTEKMELKKCT